MERRIEEGWFMLENATHGKYDAAMILKRFDDLRAGIDEEFV